MANVRVFKLVPLCSLSLAVLWSYPLPGASASTAPPKLQSHLIKGPPIGAIAGTALHFEYEIRNIGESTLEIATVQPSCGCTVASFDRTIKPGGSGTISASARTSVEMTSFDKELEVYSNDPGTPALILPLHASLTPFVTISPRATASAHFARAGAIPDDFEIILNTRARIVGTPVLAGPITATVTPGKDERHYHVRTELHPSDPFRDIMGVVELSTDRVDLPPIRLSVVGMSDAGVNATTTLVDFASLGSKPAHQVFVVYSRQRQYALTSVDSTDPLLRCEYQRLDRAVCSYSVTISYGGGWSPGRHAGSIRIRTSLSDDSEIRIPFLAEVK